MLVACPREGDLATVRSQRNQLCDLMGVSRPQIVVKVTVYLPPDKTSLFVFCCFIWLS